MRITPIAILCSQVKSEILKERIIRSEISLTHGNETIQQAGIFYCKVISDMINNLALEDAYNNAEYRNIMSKKYRVAACRLFGVRRAPERSTSTAVNAESFAVRCESSGST